MGDGESSSFSLGGRGRSESPGQGGPDTANSTGTMGPVEEEKVCASFPGAPCDFLEAICQGFGC